MVAYMDDEILLPGDAAANMRLLSGNDTYPQWEITGAEEKIVLVTQVVGIVIHVLLIFFLFYNLVKYIYRLNQKPFTILVIYAAALVTLIALIVSFVVIKNPSKNELIVEFSALFVAEWGIQLVGAA